MSDSNVVNLEAVRSRRVPVIIPARAYEMIKAAEQRHMLAQISEFAREGLERVDKDQKPLDPVRSRMTARMVGIIKSNDLAP